MGLIQGDIVGVTKLQDAKGNYRQCICGSHTFAILKKGEGHTVNCNQCGMYNGFLRPHHFGFK